MPDTVLIRPALTDTSYCEDGFPLLTADAQLPQIAGRGARRFHRYYDTCAAAFESWCRHKIFPQAQLLYHQALRNALPPPQWHAALQTVITFHEGNLLSLYTEATLIGTPQRVVIRRADTWDLRRALPVTVAECFPARAPWRSFLLQQAAQQIEQQEAQGIAAYDPLWSKKLRRYLRPQQFYLTQEGLCFFFSMHTIAPAVEGIPTFCLPYCRETGPCPPK